MTFYGAIAVITGGADGMGLEMATRLAQEGCSIAICDINERKLRQALHRCQTVALHNTKVSSHMCDVADEAQVIQFAEEVSQAHDLRGRQMLLFNNAGAALCGSFISEPRETWDRTFAINWGGVYYVCRAFMSLLLQAPKGNIVNISSVNGFWAGFGWLQPHTPYSAAKFAVKGFSEALMMDCKLNAPHISIHLVMPGLVGTGILSNSFEQIDKGNSAVPDYSQAKRRRKEFDKVQRRIQEMKAVGDPHYRAMERAKMLDTVATDISGMSDAEIDAFIVATGNVFRETATTSASDAAKIILDAVRAGKWRILVGSDAVDLDAVVRKHPEAVYDDPSLPLQTMNLLSGTARAKAKL
eukprot:m.512580 g.512580  ORF g.512580 m.512580 type:complete len:355 (+) comp21894_c0_seq1:299-1363(+)